MFWQNEKINHRWTFLQLRNFHDGRHFSLLASKLFFISVLYKCGTYSIVFFGVQNSFSVSKLWSEVVWIHQRSFHLLTLSLRSLHLPIIWIFLDHNLDNEKEFCTPKNTIGHVQHSYRTEMKNSLDANSEKWWPYWKWRNCKKVHRWIFFKFCQNTTYTFIWRYKPKIRVGEFFLQSGPLRLTVGDLYKESCPSEPSKHFLPKHWGVGGTPKSRTVICGWNCKHVNRN